MDITESEGDISLPSATTPALVPKAAPERSHGEKLKMNSTPNGYNSVSNHKIRSDGQVLPQKKHHDSSSKHSDSSKHNSDPVKRKDTDSVKHSSSSHSKPKESSEKSSSHKSNDISRTKEHGHDKEKSKEKHSKHSNSEHSKHVIVKDGTEKVKLEDKPKKEQKVADGSHKHSSDLKKSKEFKDEKHKEKPKEEKHREKQKDEKHKEKSKDEKHREKPKDEKHKEKSKDELSLEHKKIKEKSKDDKSKEVKVGLEKQKESKEKIKTLDETKDRHHEKLKDKGEKPKEKHSDKPKDKHSEKSRDKTSEKHKDKVSIKPKEKSSDAVKIKPEKDSSPEKRLEMKDQSVKLLDADKSPAIVRIKHEPSSPMKVKDESFSDDDLPLAARKPVKEIKPKPVKRLEEEEVQEDSDDEPILSRLNKAKKVKTESSKKRKADDSDYDSDYKKPAKKVKKEKEKSKVKKEPSEAPSPKKRTKKEEEQQDVWKWWEEEKQEEGVKWKTLEHHGPVFAPLYERVPKNVKFYYDGKHMPLSELTEEVAGFYGRMLDHEYTTKEAFNTNFFKDWKKVMTPEEREVIKDLKKCNFSDFNEYYKLKSEERKNMSKEEKAEIKKQNEELTEKYGYCIIDGHRQKIGNFKIEPPGLFRGRGEHPKMGMLKRRVQPEDVSINIGKEAKIPEPPGGHKWKKVLHDNKVTWLASWNENILNSTKYIMLNPSSKLKGEKDWQKYETARKLKNHADRIRQTYSEDFKSKEMRVRQRAVALYFIDKLALRAGNEKDEDTADTVGCCSLRVEHITLDEEKDGQEYVVSFDFLGKDSIRYVNSVPVEKRAFKNLKLFMENKQPGDDLFDRLNTGILNKYLNELMEGLTAKVFRTYNASKTLQEQLNLLTKEEMSIPEKLLAYNRANRAVAVLCNHQRAVPKTFSKSMENLKAKIDDKLAQIKEVKKELKAAKSDAKNSGSAKDRTLVDKKKKRLQQLEDQLKRLEVQATDKEENKQIALGTSKLNYLDPRISVAWCKKWNVPIEKIYNRTQRDKFRWAIEMAGPDFEF